MALATEAPCDVSHAGESFHPPTDPVGPTDRFATWDARGTGPMYVTGPTQACDDNSLDRIDSDIPVAKATLQVVAAYQHLQEVVPQSLPQWAVPSFRAVCDSLCSTVVALDELTATLWDGESA